MMDIEQFVDHYASGNRGQDLTTLGPTSARVASRIGNKSNAESLIATTFWQAFAFSEALPRLCSSLGVGQALKVMVVARPQIRRFDLLVLVAGGPWISHRPQAIDLDSNIFPPSEVQVGAQLVNQRSPHPAIGADISSLARELTANFNTQPFSVVIAQEPSRKMLHYPSPAVLIENTIIKKPDNAISSIITTQTVKSTAGVFAMCNRNIGLIGITGAYHALRNSSKIMVGMTPPPLNVNRSDPITDSAFIALNHAPGWNNAMTNGIMSGQTPRAKQLANFVGATSGPRSTVILSWDIDIPTPSPNRQALIYTAKDAYPGDSGAALVTDDLWIVGFGFERTDPGQVPEYCSWVWADSVMKALDISLI